MEHLFSDVETLQQIKRFFYFFIDNTGDHWQKNLVVS